MKRYIYIQIIALIFYFIPVEVKSYSNFLMDFHIVSFGVKIGDMSGKDGGLFFGLELSVYGYKDIPIGLALDYDFCKEFKKLHLGVESQYKLLPGICLGPTLLFGKNGTEYGYSAIAYHGIFIHPYISMSHFPWTNRLIFDTGAYFKWPLPIGHHDWFERLE